MLPSTWFLAEKFSSRNRQMFAIRNPTSFIFHSCINGFLTHSTTLFVLKMEGFAQNSSSLRFFRHARFLAEAVTSSTCCFMASSLTAVSVTIFLLFVEHIYLKMKVIAALLAVAGSAAAFAPSQGGRASTSLSAKAFNDAVGATAPVSNMNAAIVGAVQCSP